MRWMLIALMPLALSACGEADVSETDEYQAGYADGLEDQRVHICNKIDYSDDHAFEVLQDERICQ